MKSLAGEVVLITGAGGGFGRELTGQFLRAGSQLILTDLHTEPLESLAAQTPPARGTILGHVAADLADPAAPDLLLAGTRSLAPRVDMLVMNAGVAVSGQICDVPRDAWERLMQINLLAPMRLTAAFLPAMLERRHGHLIYISSVAGLVGVPGLASYSTAKFGLRGFGDAVAAEVRPHGVDVTLLFPYFARTPILNSPHYGPPLAGSPPFLYEPADVIAALMRGVRRRSLHVYPGAIPRTIDVTQRLAPWALPFLLTPHRAAQHPDRSMGTPLHPDRAP
jgi:NAD(P)-dependent dehydrogenase (short-subunit alcohol dehydrogenase family)